MLKHFAPKTILLYQNRFCWGKNESSVESIHWGLISRGLRGFADLGMRILIRRSGFEGHEDVWFQSMLHVSFQTPDSCHLRHSRGTTHLCSGKVTHTENTIWRAPTTVCD